MDIKAKKLKIMLIVLILMVSYLGFSVGAYYSCTNTGGHLTTNYLCLNTSSIGYCLFDSQIHHVSDPRLIGYKINTSAMELNNGI